MSMQDLINNLNEMSKIESGKEYNGSIFNIVDNTKTVIKTFSLTVGL